MLDWFSEQVQLHCGLEIQRKKTEMYSSDPGFEARADLVTAHVMVNGQFEPGMLCYGVPVGSDV